MLTGLESVPRRTQDMLDFLIVGGGITGLSCAWKLREAGHQVTVLEQKDQLWKNREPIHSVSASTRILDEWGITDLVSEIANTTERIIFLDGPTGEEMGLVNLSKQVLDSLPQFKCMPYGELYRIFYDLATQAGVLIRLNVKVVEVDPWVPMVTTADGERMKADVIIGADGLESTVRSVFAEPKRVPGVPLRYHVNLQAPAEVLRQDEELAKLVDSGTWTAWLGDDCLVHGALAGTGPNRDFAMVLYLPRLENNRDSWAQFPICDGLLNLFEPRVQKILKAAEFENRVMFVDYTPFDSWVHESGKVVMVGQAAHPVAPCGLWDCVICLEDALTLPTLFSLPATRSHTTMLLEVFEELRQPRCTTVQSYSCRKCSTLVMSSGRQQELRDEILRRQLAYDKYDGTNDDFLSIYYSGLLQLLAFDAREVIQDWWVTYGRNMLLRSPQPEPEENVLGSEPMLVATEVEGGVRPVRAVSDLLMGEYVDGIVSVDELRSSGAAGGITL